jgi:hypothetical protein
VKNLKSIRFGYPKVNYINWGLIEEKIKDLDVVSVNTISDGYEVMVVVWYTKKEES